MTLRFGTVIAVQMRTNLCRIQEKIFKRVAKGKHKDKFLQLIAGLDAIVDEKKQKGN